MALRSVLDQLLPPVVARAFARAGVLAPPPVWTGVYDRLADVPRTGAGFDGDVWIRQCEARLAQLRRDPRRAGAELLALLSATFPTTQPLRVVDFGGGLGFTYVPLADQLGHADLAYHVVETAAVCAAGRRAFADDPRIRFSTDLPPGPFDLAHVSTALQYVDDYAALLSDLTALTPRYLLLASLSIATGATFATAQHNVDGSVIPYWFLGLDEVEDLLRRAGYALRWRSSAGPLPAHALPAGRVPATMAHLLFARTT